MEGWCDDWFGRDTIDDIFEINGDLTDERDDAGGVCCVFVCVCVRSG